MSHFIGESLPKTNLVEVSGSFRVLSSTVDCTTTGRRERAPTPPVDPEGDGPTNGPLVTDIGLTEESQSGARDTGVLQLFINNWLSEVTNRIMSVCPPDGDDRFGVTPG